MHVLEHLPARISARRLHPWNVQVLLDELLVEADRGISQSEKEDAFRGRSLGQRVVNEVRVDADVLARASLDPGCHVHLRRGELHRHG
jgi:hypothetical protein